MFRILFFTFLLFCISCKNTPSESKELTDTNSNTDLWLDYSKESSTFKLWSPPASEVQLHFYEKGNGGEPFATHNLEKNQADIWTKSIQGDLNGTYYTYQVKIDDEWLNETPGIYAQAVGVNGKRAMVLDLDSTNPEGWDKDKGSELKYPNEAIIYELHVRDMTIHPSSGSSMPGKYLGLVEKGTTGPKGVKTSIDHLLELGITHVHLLPSYDHYSINEEKLDSAQFNWGYDPQNYNVPEGSFSSDPFNAEVRIKEFKQMVKSFHDHGIGVILDVVYNHTGRTEDANFNLEVPDYYYRQWEDGKYSDASACGNETASEKEMMRNFMIESVVYWTREYHLDGFRFDLMGIHDISTMNEVAKAAKAVNPNLIIYGEGWTAGDSPLPLEQRALKRYTYKMDQISAFSDDIRDGLKGSVFDEKDTGFVNGGKDKEQSVMFGIVGSIDYPGIDPAAIKDADKPWAKEPWQSISYVSCHDNHTIYDKLKISREDASEDMILRMNKLANAVVMTSQGTAFIHAGAELLRTKNGEHNSYNLPDKINQIDWNWKVDNQAIFEYYKNLIDLRKSHPAFRMTSAEDVRNHLKFKRTEDGLISYQINNNANGDSWKTIHVIYNAKPAPINYDLKGEWYVGVLEDDFISSTDKLVKSTIQVPPISMLVLYQS
jgi:pullulanase